MSEPILETRNLGKRFGHFAANADIDFRVTAGELRAVIGPNGAGKTTFFNLIAGTTEATDGEILFRGKPVTKLDGPARVRLGVAKAFQTANIYPEQSVRQNARLAGTLGAFSLDVFRLSTRLRGVDELADEALAAVDLQSVANVRSGDLSHGDKKRLDIALALATKPDVLLLDEPVAGMSLEESRKTKDLIRSLAGGITVLLIEHDMDLIMGISDAITVLHGGKILAEGTPAEIRANPLVRDAYLGGHSNAEMHA